MSDYNYTAADDFQFAYDSGEPDFQHQGVVRIAPCLRYAASLHPEMTRAEFVTQMKAKGIHSDTATKQFAQSRKFDVDNWGCTVRPDGVMIEGEWSQVRSIVIEGA